VKTANERQHTLIGKILGVIMEAIRILLLTAIMMLMGIYNCSAQSTAQNQPSAEALAAAKTLFSILQPAPDANLTAQLEAKAWPDVETALRASYPQISPEALLALRTEFQRIYDAFSTEIMNESPDAYARLFTVAELRQLIAFYQTPTGQKYLRVFQDIQKQSLVSFNERLPAVREQMNGAFNAILRVYGYRP
jgi:hypothetical protein